MSVVYIAPAPAFTSTGVSDETPWEASDDTSEDTSGEGCADFSSVLSFEGMKSETATIIISTLTTRSTSA